MNREEILNMSAGREMDILVLRDVMKYKPVFVEEGSIFGTPGELDHWYDENGAFVMLGTSPSTDISDAWKVVDKFKKEDYDVEVKTTIHNWSCILGRNVGHGETATLAICRAALLTLESK